MLVVRDWDGLGAWRVVRLVGVYWPVLDGGRRDLVDGVGLRPHGHMSIRVFNGKRLFLGLSR